MYCLGTHTIISISLFPVYLSSLSKRFCTLPNLEALSVYQRERRRETATETRRSKLPPRLAKQREQSNTTPKNHVEIDTFDMPKIESWDNEMANDIPQAKVSASSVISKPSSTHGMQTSATSQPSSTYTSPGVPMPAPTPSTNAWDKPISITNVTPSLESAVTSQTAVPVNSSISSAVSQTDSGKTDCT